MPWKAWDAVRDFDFVGFTLQYELSFTNILNMLDLAGIPLHARDRGETLAPLVVAGGRASVIRNRWQISLTCLFWARAKKSTWN